jgi:dethiobiotin synthetase
MSELKKYFVTGIGTNIGKTICSAILVEALEADYWKPVQSGDLDYSDSDKVRGLISNVKSVFHRERFRLTQPMSPHAAARVDQVSISISDFKLPDTNNTLVIEGAGGLMVPLNDRGDLIVDLIQHLEAEVILISQNYLGSINHTLLSIEALKSRKLKIAGIIFNGPSNNETEEIILSISGLKCLGKIPQSEHIKPKFISEQAALLNSKFKSQNSK